MPPDMQSQNTNELLIRLDERTKSIERELKNINDEITDLKKQLKQDENDSKVTLKGYVTKEEFSPIQRSIYAVTSLIIMTVIGTILSLVVHK